VIWSYLDQTNYKNNESTSFLTINQLGFVLSGPGDHLHEHSTNRKTLWIAETVPCRPIGGAWTWSFGAEYSANFRKSRSCARDKKGHGKYEVQVAAEVGALEERVFQLSRNCITSAAGVVNTGYALLSSTIDSSNMP